MMQEADTCANLIDPALRDAGWEDLTFVKREYSFTDYQSRSD
jgi:type I site-specific restriction endonuclease